MQEGKCCHSQNLQPSDHVIGLDMVLLDSSGLVTEGEASQADDVTGPDTFECNIGSRGCPLLGSYDSLDSCPHLQCEADGSNSLAKTSEAQCTLKRKADDSISVVFEESRFPHLQCEVDDVNFLADMCKGQRAFKRKADYSINAAFEEHQFLNKRICSPLIGTHISKRRSPIILLSSVFFGLLFLCDIVMSYDD